MSNLPLEEIDLIRRLREMEIAPFCEAADAIETLIAALEQIAIRDTEYYPDIKQKLEGRFARIARAAIVKAKA